MSLGVFHSPVLKCISGNFACLNISFINSSRFCRSCRSCDESSSSMPISG